MAPTTCRGFSAARAMRNFAPAESGAGIDSFMIAGSLRLPADDYDRAARDRALDVRLERAGRLRERTRARHDAVQVPGVQIARDALPHLEPLGPRGRRRVDAEQIDASQNERHHRHVELRATGEPNAGDVPPEIHLAGEAGQ